jgi:hypothetical protein
MVGGAGLRFEVLSQLYPIELQRCAARLRALDEGPSLLLARGGSHNVA